MNKSFYIVFIFLFANTISSQLCVSQPIVVDIGYNSDDLGNHYGDGANGIILTTCLQPDGKIIIGGNFTKYNGVDVKNLARLMPNGDLDTSFHTGTGPNYAVNDIYLLSSGRILIGGTFGTYDGILANRICRLNSDGTIDQTFTTGLGVSGTVERISCQSNGKIIVGGSFTGYNGNSALNILRLNSDGTFDPSFNIGSGANNYVYAVEIQPDDKIIIGGWFTSYNGNGTNHIARLQINGTIDITFNANFSDAIEDIELQTDGKILVGGSFTTVNGISKNKIVRLTSTGALDNSFSIGSGANYDVNEIAIQPNGSILIGGWFTQYNGTSKVRIARLTTNGTIDPTFNTVFGADSTVLSISLLDDGSIIIAGNFTDVSDIKRGRIAKLTSSGSVDITFTPATGSNEQIFAINTNDSGYTYIGGDFSIYNGQIIHRIARLFSDGCLDPSFNPGTGPNAQVYAIGIQSDGKVIIGGGFTKFGGNTELSISRLNTNGTLDNTFHPSNNGCGYAVRAIAVQSDDKIVIGGTFTECNGIQRKYIARLNADGTLDNAFNASNGLNNDVYAIAIQPDGKILIGGYFTLYNLVQVNKIARLNPDGTLDTTFHTGPGLGFESTNSVASIAVLSDGKIIVGGRFSHYNGIDVENVVRLEQDGDLDLSFSPVQSEMNGLEEVLTVCTLPEGAIFAGGRPHVSSFNNKGGIKLTASGASDNTFLVMADERIYASANQYKSKILVGGKFTNISGIGRNRYAQLNMNCDTTYISLDVDACESYTTPSGDVWLTSRTENDTVLNIFGCDTIYTISVNIHYEDTTHISAEACDSYSFNGSNIFTSGEYQDTLQGQFGCDSLIILDLTISQSFLSEESKSICDSSGVFWHNATFFTEGVYYDSLITGNGCDSIYKLELSVDTLNLLIDVAGNDLIAQQDNSLYQWLDCNNNMAALPFANNQSYTASASGSYAVVLNNGHCIDTTACSPFVLSNDEVSDDFLNNIIENNENGIIIRMNSEKPCLIRVYALSGSIILENSFENCYTLGRNTLLPGLYLIEIRSLSSSEVLARSVVEL